MKVRVTVTLDIDPEAWANEYGVDGAAAIREDVQHYGANLIREQLANVGVLADA